MKNKVIAMIPARLNSKRVIKKNLRLIEGKPLISYIIEKVKKIGLFDKIYLNSESEIFQEIAEKEGIDFYKRDRSLSTDKSTNDDFALDFLNNISCDILIQILPTSPLISSSEIENFLLLMHKHKYDTLISVVHTQIASLYNTKPINFNPLKVNPPSQTMEPIKSYATVLMGWKSQKYKENMEKYGCAYHGGDGKTGFFEISGLSTIDIDREDDFLLVERIIKAENIDNSRIEYYGDSKSNSSEVDVEKILKKDGVKSNDLYDVNKEIVNIKDIFSKMDSKESWSKRVIDSESNSMTIISQLPGEGNRLHYHPNWNEWWYILDGEWEWEIENQKKVVKKGDIVFMRKNRQHKITAKGDKPAVRMAVSRADVAHIYINDK